MRKKCNTGILVIVAVLLVASTIVVWELYQLQQVAPQDMLLSIHKSVSTVVIGTGVAVAMLFMLMGFINLYYIRPVNRLNRALRNWLSAHTPFNPTFEGGGRQLRELRDNIERLVEQNKKINC